MDGQIIKNTLITLFLVFILLFLLTFTNIIKCSSVPYWCDVYFSIKGEPRVLIAYGNDGLGDPQKLQEILGDKELMGIRTYLREIEYLTPGELTKYDLVIVTRAKTISTDKMQMFYDYVTGSAATFSTGGRLIWTGDAGTLSSYEQRALDSTASKLTPSNAWVRVVVNEDQNTQKVLHFNELISVDYIDLMCNLTSCNEYGSYAGKLIHHEDSVVGKDLKNGLPIFGNFALVRLINNSSTILDLRADYQTEIISQDVTKKSYGNLIPVIVVSGLRKNIMYSAMPLEYYVVKDCQNDTIQSTEYMCYPSLIMNSYKMMLGDYK